METCNNKEILNTKLLNIVDTFDNLVKAIKELFFYLQDESHNIKNEILSQKPIDDLELTTRSTNALKQAEIFTIGKLIQYTASQLLQITNLGRKSVNEIKAVLWAYELTLSNQKKLPDIIPIDALKL